MDKSGENERIFNSFLNKTIILTAREYYREENKTKAYEIELVEDYDNIKNWELFAKYDNYYNTKDMKEFIEFMENPFLICALK